jgi:hypothetical protein
MNDQNPNPDQPPSANSTSDSYSSYRDWREQRRAERWARREARWQRRAGRHTGWFAGLLLILLGVVFLLQNLGILSFANWWALFILIPAFWAFIAAWDIYQEDHRLTRRGAGPLTVGILFTGFALIFLLNLATDLFWPILLIVGGLVLVGTVFLPE